MSLKKWFIGITAVVIVFLTIFIFVSSANYSQYTEGQEVAISSLRVVTNQFEKYSDNRTKMITEMYDYLMRAKYSSYTKDIDYALGDILRSSGYYCVQGSDYLRYTNYLEYIFGEMTVFTAIIVIAILSDTVIAIFYFKKRDN